MGFANLAWVIESWVLDFPYKILSVFGFGVSARLC